jgi:hypothetical protein
MKGIVVANGSALKSKPLSLILLEIDALWTFMRLLYDLKGISRGEFEVLSELLSKVAPQIQNWLKWEKQRIKDAIQNEKQVTKK